MDSKQEKYEAKIAELKEELQFEAVKLGKVISKRDIAVSETHNAKEELISIRSQINDKKLKFTELNEQFEYKSGYLKKLVKERNNEVAALEARIKNLSDKDILVKYSNDRTDTVMTNLSQVVEEISIEEKNLSSLKDSVQKAEVNLDALNQNNAKAEEKDVQRVLRLRREEEALQNEKETFIKTRKALAFYGRRLERLYNKLKMTLPEDVLEVINALK